MSTQLACAQSIAEQRVVTRIETELKSAPDTVSRILQRLPAQTQLTQMPGRFGPWIQVRTGQGKLGWLQRLDVSGARYAEAPTFAVAIPTLTGTEKIPLNNAPSGVLFDSPALSSSQVGSRVSATLSSELPTIPPELPVTQRAGIAEQRLEQLQTYRADSEAARKFAFMASLELVKLPKALTVPPFGRAVVPTETATALGSVPDEKATP